MEDTKKFLVTIKPKYKNQLNKVTEEDIINAILASLKNYGGKVKEIIEEKAK